MLTELGRSPGEVPQCSLRSDPGEEDWRRGLAKRIGETLGEEDWRGGGGGRGREDGEGVVLIKSSNPHLAGGEKKTQGLIEPTPGYVWGAKIPSVFLLSLLIT